MVDGPKTFHPVLRIGHVFAGCLHELLFMERGAFCFVFEFPVALPNYPAVLAVGVPDLRAIYTAAVPADDLAGEWGEAIMPPTQVFPPGNLQLNCFPLGWFDNSRVAVLHIVLGLRPR